MGVALANAVALNSTLLYLDLEGTSIGAQGAFQFAITIGANSTLRHLVLRNCGVTPAAAYALGEAKEKSETLYQLIFEPRLLEIHAHDVEGKWASDYSKFERK
jgi:hypothetical protein